MHRLAQKTNRADASFDAAARFEKPGKERYPLLFEAALDFFSARFSFRDLDAAVFAVFFFGDLSAIEHPSLRKHGRLRAPNNTSLP